MRKGATGIAPDADLCRPVEFAMVALWLHCWMHYRRFLLAPPLGGD